MNAAEVWHPYPAYRSSGLSWLDEIPSHWTASVIKREFSVQLGKMLQSSPSGPDDTLEFYLRTANLFWTGVGLSDVKQMWFSPKEKAQYALQLGDLLISEGGDVGRSALWRGELAECYIQNAVNRVRSRGVSSTRYLYYWLYALKHSGYIDMLCNKATIAHYTAEKVERTEILLPPADEQRSIADFLDRETARIDALIAKKQRLIELLQEKRTALISHAVTMGLDPDVPMKDSGVAWLGQVPEHWKLMRVRHLSSDMVAGPFGSSLTKDMYTTEGFRVYGQEQVIPGDFSIGDYYIPGNKYGEMMRYAVRTGDVLISCVGTFGKVAVVPSDAEEGIINPRLVKLTPDTKLILPEYLELFLKSETSFSQMELFSRGGTMGVINLGLISDILAAVPPVEEQRQILNVVQRQADHLNTLIKRVEDASSKFQEYRTALISAAVTGKIDVREETTQ